MAHAAIVRSPHAHARIVGIDTSKAEALPGVIRVVTGADVAERAAPLPSFGAGPIVQDLIAIEKVRHYGEAVAAVVAEDRYIAEDACDLIEVEYEPLPVVLDPFEARKEGAPLVHEVLGTNVAYERTFTFGEVDRAFEEAPRKVQATLHWPRSTGMPMDTNGAIGDYDAGSGVVTIYANSMNFTYFHWLIAGVAEDPDQQAEGRPRRRGRQLRLEVLHAQGADVRRLPLDGRRPAGQVRRGPDHAHRQQRPLRLRPSYEAELAFDDDGTFRALRIDCVDDYGAYLQFGTGTHGNGLSQIVGPYRIQHVEYALHAVLTNKNQQGAYRGFGAEVSNWMLERLVDFAARDLGMDRVEIRRRNLIAPDQFPYRTPTGNIYDSGNYQGVLEKVLEAVDYEHWLAVRERRARRAATSGSASSPRTSAASSARRSSGSGSTSRRSRRPRARRARASRSTRPARSSSRSTRSRSGATARRRWSPRSWPRSSTSTRVASSSPTPTRSTRCPAPAPAARATR